MRPSERIDELHRALRGPLPGDEAKRMMWSRPSGARRTSADGPLTKAAVLILLYEEDERLKLPLMLRTHAEGDVHAGQISLPGGKREGDESLQETALRETHEEIGVDPALVQVLGELSPQRIPVSGFEVHPIVATCAMPPRMRPDPIEVQQIVVTSIEELESPERRSTLERTFSGREVRIPCWRLDAGVLWGATAMILSELLALWNPTNPAASNPTRPR